MRRWHFWLGIAVSAFFLLWALQGLDLQQVAAYLQQGQYLWLIPSVAVYFLAVLVRTWRWDYLLRPLQRIPLRRLFPVVVIGYMGNNIFPFRIGELLRAYVLKRNEEVNISSSLATIVVERIFDGLTMLLFVFIALPTVPALPDGLRFIVLLGGVLFLYGARMARGCTSGQALSGGATLSAGSWAVMLAIFAGSAAQYGMFAATYGLAVMHFLQPHTQVVIIGHDDVVDEQFSLDIGAVRLTQRFFRSGDIDKHAVRECRKYINRCRATSSTATTASSPLRRTAIRPQTRSTSDSTCDDMNTVRPRLRTSPSRP